MSFLTDEHKLLQQTARQFIEKEVVPIADALDREGREIPEGLVRKVAELGFLGLTFPEEYGGAGMDHISLAIVAEELSRGWLSVGSLPTRNLIAGTLLLAHGTEEQKRRWLPGIATGQILTAAAFTEPTGGSDTANIKLRATRDPHAPRGLG